MTREQILAELYKVNRVCRGAPRFDSATRDALSAQLGACHTDSDRVALLNQIAATLGQPAPSVAADWVSIQTLIFSYQENCGQDFNAIIGTYPFDGKIRDVNCPKCGTAQHFQSPLVG